jgi:hypothetical protein
VSVTEPAEFVDQNQDEEPNPEGRVPAGIQGQPSHVDAANDEERGYADPEQVTRRE